jgi:hypothetical protein
MTKKTKEDYQKIIEGDILDLLGLGDAKQEKKDQLYKKMLSTIQNRVVARVLDELEGEDVEKFKDLIEKGEEDDIKQFIEDKNMNINELMAQESLIYKTEIVSLVEDGDIK